MAFALAIIGVMLLVSAARNKQDDLFSLVKGDFTGEGNFIYWFSSILIIGAVGYIPKLKPVSVGFMTLVVIVLFLTKGDPLNASGGFFEKFMAGLNLTGRTNLSPSITNQPVPTDINGPITNPTFPGLANLTPLGGIQ